MTRVWEQNQNRLYGLLCVVLAALIAAPMAMAKPILQSSRPQICSNEMQIAGIEPFWSVTLNTTLFLDNVPHQDSRWFTGDRIERIWVRIASAPARSQLILTLMSGLKISRKDASALINGIVARFGTAIPISSVLPMVVEEKTNCFNAVEMWFFDDARVRNMPLHEFNDLLANSFVKVETDLPMLGDVLVIKDEYSDVMHAGIVVTPNLIWHKPSAFMDPWTFEMRSNVIKPYKEVEGDDLKVEYWRLR